MEGTARVMFSSKAEGFIVVIAESLKREPWWLYHTLAPGGDSLKTLGVDDVDVFCVYNASTRKIVTMLGDGRWGHIFRIHDYNYVRISKKSDTEAWVNVIEKSTFKSGLHQCVSEANGSIDKVMDKVSDCSKQITLKLNSAGLSYPWDLPQHIAYDSTTNIKW